MGHAQPCLSTHCVSVAVSSLLTSRAPRLANLGEEEAQQSTAHSMLPREPEPPIAAAPEKEGPSPLSGRTSSILTDASTCASPRFTRAEPFAWGNTPQATDRGLLGGDGAINCPRQKGKEGPVMNCRAPIAETIVHLCLDAQAAFLHSHPTLHPGSHGRRFGRPLAHPPPQTGAPRHSFFV